MKMHDVCKWHYKNREARTLYVTDGTYISPTTIKKMRDLTLKKPNYHPDS